jgi:sugar lactone lactonase YvrE
MAPQVLEPGEIVMEEVAQSARQWTGVAVSHAGRIFVCFPRWSDDVPVSVAELRPEQQEGFTLARPRLLPVAYPDAQWQRYGVEGADPGKHFVCVQSVVVDDRDHLWILDAGSPKTTGLVPGAAKLVDVDLQTNGVVRVYPFDGRTVFSNSYLNDVRVDTKHGVAYLTDSGAGAIVVLNLQTGVGRRVLGDDPSTKSEYAIPVIDGKPWKRPDGSVPEAHADGIALSPDGAWLYYHALTGNSLYRVPTGMLLDESATTEQIHRKIEPLGRTGNCDGMEYDEDGRVFLTQIQINGIARFEPAGTGNRVEVLVQSPDISWPDSFAIGPDGGLYFTTSQIQAQPNPPGPYRLFKLTEKKK